VVVLNSFSSSSLTRNILSLKTMRLLVDPRSFAASAFPS
jgi:hypothetical protein